MSLLSFPLCREIISLKLQKKKQWIDMLRNLYLETFFDGNKLNRNIILQHLHTLVATEHVPGIPGQA